MECGAVTTEIGGIKPPCVEQLKLWKAGKGRKTTSTVQGVAAPPPLPESVATRRDLTPQNRAWILSAPEVSVRLVPRSVALSGRIFEAPGRGFGAEHQAVQGLLLFGSTAAPSRFRALKAAVSF